MGGRYSIAECSRLSPELLHPVRGLALELVAAGPPALNRTGFDGGSSYWISKGLVGPFRSAERLLELCWRHVIEIAVQAVVVVPVVAARLDP